MTVLSSIKYIRLKTFGADMTDLVALGKRLTSERERLDLKAVDVYADHRICIAQTTYKNYETGKRDMPISLLAKLWDMGFDVMYVLTGQRLEALEDDAVQADKVTIQARLVHLPDEMDTFNPADALLLAMYHVEEAMIQAGAVANIDYDYKDLAKIAVGMVDIVK